MRIGFIATEAMDSLASNGRRSFLAALGLLVGVASVVCVIAAGQGLKGLILREMGSFSRPTHMTVTANYRYLSSIGWTKRPEPISAEDQEDIAAMADLVSGISPTAEFQFTSRYGDKSGVTRIMSVSADYFPMERLVLARGRSFNVTDDRNLRRAAILGAGIAEKFFGKPGSYGAEDPLGKRVSIGNFGEVEVVGVLEREPPSLFQAIQSYDSTNNGTVFVPFSAVGRFGGNRETYQLYVEASSENSVERAQEAILTLLSRNHGQWDGTPKYSVETGKSALSEIDSMTALVTSFVSAVAGLSLIVAGIGVMNVMLISVKERTREIGTRKALGARGAWIGRQFLVESLAVCVSGGVAGVFLAAAAATAVAHFASLPVSVPANTVPLSLGLSVAIAFAFGWLPARRASKLDPCEALRYE